MSRLLQPILAQTLPTAINASGSYIYDAEGIAYLDGSGGPMTVSLGHSLRPIIDAMVEQLKDISFCYRTQFTNQPAESLAKLLTSLAPNGLDYVFFINSGSEATEVAIRTSIQYWRDLGKPKKLKVLGRRTSYHGMTLGAISVSGHAARRSAYQNLLYPFALAETPNLYRSILPPDKYLIALLSEWESIFRREDPDTIAAIIVEPIVGAAGGALVPPEGYLSSLSDLCQRYEILLIVDEVVTGIARTGRWFACEYDNVTPDILITAKGMSSGYTPMGAMLITTKLRDVIAEHSGLGPFGHTFSNNPLSAATCLAVLHYMRQYNILDNVKEREIQLREGLLRLQQQYSFLDGIRGRGLLYGFELVESKATKSPITSTPPANQLFVSAAFAERLIVYPAGVAPFDNAVIISPPLNISKEDLSELLARLSKSLLRFSKLI